MIISFVWSTILGLTQRASFKPSNLQLELVCGEYLRMMGVWLARELKGYFGRLHESSSLWRSSIERLRTHDCCSNSVLPAMVAPCPLRNDLVVFTCFNKVSQNRSVVRFVKFTLRNLPLTTAFSEYNSTVSFQIQSRHEQGNGRMHDFCNRGHLSSLAAGQLYQG